MNKLLTISIPSWNRAQLLDDLLNSLCNDLLKNNLENQIQILVSNNSSDDNTESIVSKYLSKFDFITYNKNASNIGAKSNVLKSMELSETPFVFFIGDDDRINTTSLHVVLDVLKNNHTIGFLMDTSKSKFQYGEKIKKISTNELAKNFYWYMGNAGFFVIKADFVRDGLKKYGYDFFNECWPQTQLTLLGLENSVHDCIVADINILKTSLHTDVMVYSSFYLWRTCYYELLTSLNDLKDKISIDVYNSAKSYLKHSLVQQTYNILQCGIFVDNPSERRKTRMHISQNMHLFSIYEKLFLTIIILVLTLPTFLSKPLSNLAILFLRGRKGLKKKNDFVEKELSKKLNPTEKKKIIRALEFEK